MMLRVEQSVHSVASRCKNYSALRFPVTKLRPTRLRSPVVHCQASSAGDSHAGYAGLHDFCMTIPYGTVSFCGGIVAYFLGATDIGAKVAAAGLVVCITSFLSLKTWKAGNSSLLFTATSGGVAGATSWVMYQRMKQGVGNALATKGLLALSGALVLFCLYNIFAGGNPPKKH